MTRLAMLSLHTSPLAQPGTGDGGGMNVYVHEFASALARAGVDVQVLTRDDGSSSTATIVDVMPGYRVVHIEAGPRRHVSRSELVELIPALTDGVRTHLLTEPTDVLHANYWISGAVAHTLKHELDLPLVSTFHTLALVKAQAGITDDPAVRAKTEGEIARCSDLVLASTTDERHQLVTLYGVDRSHVEILPPGVDHTEFSPGPPGADDEARRALGLDRHKVLLFVGRIQPLKGADVAVRSLALVDDPETVLVIVGGPSGADGVEEFTRLEMLVDDLGLRDRVRFVPPRPHGELYTWYRAAHACIVPSRTESFGLVALEAAACATPVIAADISGLRSIIVDGETGLLVDALSPEAVAGAVQRLLDDPEAARDMGAHAARHAIGFTWGLAAARLRRLLADVQTGEPLRCT